MTSILEYGAVADGATNNAVAIQRGINTISAAGGGRLTIPAGTFLSGSIELKAGVELHLERGAVAHGVGDEGAVRDGCPRDVCVLCAHECLLADDPKIGRAHV